MRWWPVLVLSALGGGLAVSWTNVGNQALVTIERGDLVLGVSTEGELEAVVSQQITPPQVERIWNFQISMMAPEGSDVTPGQPVLALDSTELRQELRQAEAEAEGSAKELEKVSEDMAILSQQLELRLVEARARFQRADLKASSDRQVSAEVELRKAAIELELEQKEIALLVEAKRQRSTQEWFEVQNLRGKVELARSRVASQWVTDDSVQPTRLGDTLRRTGNSPRSSIRLIVAVETPAIWATSPLPSIRSICHFSIIWLLDVGNTGLAA